MEPHKAAIAVHFLEASRDQSDDCSRDLRSSEVHADTLAGPRGRVEERKVVCHAGPHACDDDSEKETKETVSTSVTVGGSRGGGAH